MKLILTYWLLLFCIISSCQTQKSELKDKKQKENTDGGSCLYEHKIYPAIILWIDSSNVENCDLQLYLPIGSKDTIYYSMKNHNLLKLENIRSEKLKIGDTIIYQQSHMIEGSCNPFIESIRVKKYSK